MTVNGTKPSNLMTYLHSGVSNVFGFNCPHFVDLGIATASPFCTLMKCRRGRGEYMLDGLKSL